MRCYTVKRVCWSDEAEPLRRIRESVFMQEQQVPADLEWDGEDEGAIHLLAYDDTHSAIGCARVLADGHIGRMAVLKPWRDNGVGSALLREAIAVVREFGCDVAFLDAQCEAIPFYQREHFVAEGEVFLDAGIPHRKMRLPLSLEAAGY